MTMFPSEGAMIAQALGNAPQGSISGSSQGNVYGLLQKEEETEETGSSLEP